jgi:hypothetical protein
VKRVQVLTRQAGVTDPQLERAFAGVGSSRVSGTAAQRTQDGGLLDLPHPHADARRRFSRPGLFAVDALWWTDGASAPPLPDVIGADLAFTVESHLGWGATDADDVDVDDVVKQVSFLHASEGTPLDKFRSHYRDHVEVARAHMPALWQYRQNDVVAVSGAQRAIGAGVVAISELWFRSTDDFLHRYFASPADEAEFRSHEGFLDLPKAFSFVCSSHALGPEPGREPGAR